MSFVIHDLLILLSKILETFLIWCLDKPLGRYSTSEMARDVLEVADHIGWTEKRQLNVAGVSMGGMIAQEIAYIAPDRIASLSLISTAAGLVATTVCLPTLS